VIVGNGRRRLWPGVGVGAAYVLITLIMTYPLATRLTTQAAGRGNDLWIHHWNNWWVRKVLLEGGNVYWTPYMFYPIGVDLRWHSFSWFSIALWLPLQPLAGPLAAHNVTVLLTYVLSAYTAYSLARGVVDSRWAAMAAGLVFAFYPARQAHLNQLNLLSVEWLPLCALYLMRLTHLSRLRDGLGFGVALGLCALAGLHQLVLAGIWAVLWLACTVITERTRWGLNTLKAATVAVLIFVIIAGPLLLPVFRGLLEPDVMELGTGDTGEKRTDLLAFFLPSRDHPLVKGLFGDLYASFAHFSGRPASVGYGVLILGVWAAWRRWRKARLWAFSALSLALLALGSSLQVNGRELPGVWLPYRLLASTLLGIALRHPFRLNLLLALPVAMLVALGMDDLLARLDPARRRWAATGVLALLIFEYLAIPYPTTVPVSSPFFEDLRKEPGKFAVADLPIGFHAHDKWYLYNQTLHGRPMVGGHVSRVPAHIHDFINSIPLLAAARAAPPGRGQLDAISRELKPLAEAGVRYVIVHKYRLRPGELERWKEWFAFRPWYEDEYLLVYRTAPEYGQDFSFINKVGDGIGVISASLSRESLPRDETLDVEVVWGTYKAPTGDWVAHLALVDAVGEEIQGSDFAPCERWPTTKWGQDAVARGRGTLQVSPLVRGGTYTVTVSLVNPASGKPVGHPATIGRIEIQEPREGRTAVPKRRPRVSVFLLENDLLPHCISR